MQSLCEALEKQGKTFKDTGITGIFSGGTEFTPQWTRFCVEEYFGGPPEESGIYMTPTYGNTLMGLACSKPVTAEEGYKISYYAPQPRAVAEVVDFDDPLKVVPYGETRPREAHHAHQRALHPRLPGTRRRRARKALRQIPLGRRQRREALARHRGADDGGGVLDRLASVPMQVDVPHDLKVGSIGASHVLDARFVRSSGSAMPVNRVGMAALQPAGISGGLSLAAILQASDDELGTCPRPVDRFRQARWQCIESRSMLNLDRRSRDLRVNDCRQNPDATDHCGCP